jgi:hypothetical protein
MEISCSMLAGASPIALVALGAGPAGHSCPRFARSLPPSPVNNFPPPDPKFGGVIKEKASVSKTWTGPRGCLPISFECNND